jgi:glycerol kinase
MVSNSWMAQDLANILNLDVIRPDFTETTALGAAMLAAVGSGLYATLQEATAMCGANAMFCSTMDDETRSARIAGWADALLRVL